MDTHDAQGGHQESGYIGRWWHKNDAGKIECDLCPRHCVLKPGQRGFCFVRKATDDGIQLTAYGQSSGFCIDPIEKKPLNHFYPGSSVLSFGTVGCNLACQFCQNWDISKARKQARLLDSASPQALAQAALKYNCQSVAFTYNDPVIWAEYAIDIAKECHKHDIKTVAVTAGYIEPQAREEFFQHIDAANVDLKAFTEEFYKKNCLAELAPVLDTLKYLVHETNVWVEITNLLIPGENDSSEEIARMCQWIKTELNPFVPLHFTAFHPDFRMKDKPHTPPHTLQHARNIALECGLKFVYTGNVHDIKGSSTYCPHCSACVIERDWYELGAYHIKNSCCTFCGTKIPGYFTDIPGNWGAKRAALRIQS